MENTAQLSLRSRCLDLAEEFANEVNGDLAYVPQEDVEAILAGLTELNLEEKADDLAGLAAWFN